jgi:predicted MFS family arabinose efflux permease
LALRDKFQGEVDKILETSARRGTWIVAMVFAITMAFALVPTPLWPLYQMQAGFTTVEISIAFAVYAVGVTVSLLFAGRSSDHLGRRPIMLVAVAVEVLAAVVFATSPTLLGVLAARLISGVGIGLATAAATAYLVELGVASRSGAAAERAYVVSTFATMGGFAFGALVSGLLSEYAPHPLVIPYLPFAAALVLGGAALRLVPETVREPAGRWSPQRIRLPHSHRRAYAAAAGAVLAANALFGTVTVLAPVILASVLKSSSPTLAGAVVGGMFLASATAQVLLRNTSSDRQLRIGWTGFVLGLGVMPVGLTTGSVGLFAGAAALAGAGAGLVFKAALTIGGGLAAVGQRGETLAGLYLAFYAGLTLPVVGMGAMASILTWESSLIVFAGVGICVMSAGCFALVRAGGRSTAIRA